MSEIHEKRVGGGQRLAGGGTGWFIETVEVASEKERESELPRPSSRFKANPGVRQLLGRCSHCPS